MDTQEHIPTYLIYIGIFIAVFVIALAAFLFMAKSKTKNFSLEANQLPAPQQVDNAQAEEPSPSQNDTLKLTVSSPDDNSFINTTTTKIAGATKPGTTITITGGAKDVASETNDDGSFAIDVPLSEGENKLTITVFDQSGQQKEITRTVYVLVEG